MGLRIIGLLPKRKKDLAEKIASTVEKELISHRDLRAIIQTEDFHLETGKVIKSKIDSFINEKLYSNSLLSIFLSPEVTSRLTETLMEELQKEIPGIIDSLFEAVESKLVFKDIIRKKIEDFEMSKLETIVFTIASSELKSIEYFGGILGFVVGVIQVGILLAGELYV